MINRDAIRAGDRVKFRNGGVSEVMLDETLMFVDNIPLGVWHKNGLYSGGGREYKSGIDIIEIIPAPKPRVVTGYVNVYKDCAMAAFDTKLEADESFHHDGGVATLKLTYDLDTKKATIEEVL